MLNKIYFYAVDPGAVSIMQPIVDSSPDDVQCFWVAEACAKSYFDSKGIEYFDTDNAERRLKAGDVFILGSQMNFLRTAERIKSFSKKSIKSVFIFDHWANYSKHFTLTDNSFALPKRIFVMDEYVKANLVKLGINESKIRIIGHLGIEFEVKRARRITSRRKQKIREKIGVASGERIVLLALQPLSEDFVVDNLDYDEYAITILVQQALEELEIENLRFVIRLHPRQQRSKFYSFLVFKKLHERIILCPKEVIEAESLAIADLVLGIKSVFLIKALVLGKPTISLQFNPKDYHKKSDKIPYLEKIKVNNPSELGVRISEKLYQQPCEKILLPLGNVRKAWDEIRMLV